MNFKKIAAFKLPIPDLLEQRHFVSIVESVEQQKIESPLKEENELLAISVASIKTARRSAEVGTRNAER